ncbi:hypothetical protein WR25_13642 [Diploscapter pachys]|uniref:Uncharacterized protein n=1 Tax=Diploscapter pachys TaxID=2018661 RepID=A0A2A2KPC5_9BILA|nr:hypothetical protein WR25_13642 [Diploscapter pachys]
MCYINEKLRIENVQSINEPEMAKNRKYNEADQDGFILASGNEGNININKDNSVTGITLSEIEMNAIVKDVMTVSSPICPERIEKLNSIAEFTFHMLSTKSCSPFGLRNCSTMVLYCLRKWLSVMSIITQFILLTHTLFDGTLTWGRR